MILIVRVLGSSGLAVSLSISSALCTTRKRYEANPGMHRSEIVSLFLRVTDVVVEVVAVSLHSRRRL